MKRYKQLNAALNYLKTDDEQPNPKAPAGTPLARYQEWRSGERNINYDRDDASKPGGLERVALQPFGLDLDPLNLAIVPVSQRTSRFSAEAQVINAGGLLVEPPEVAKVVRGFIPAKAVISTPASGASTGEKTSQITGKKYQASGKVSYTFPYGQKSGTTREGEARAAIVTAIQTINDTSVSFTSEKL